MSVDYRVIRVLFVLLVLFKVAVIIAFGLKNRNSVLIICTLQWPAYSRGSEARAVNGSCALTILSKKYAYTWFYTCANNLSRCVGFVISEGCILHKTKHKSTNIFVTPSCKLTALLQIITNRTEQNIIIFDVNYLHVFFVIQKQKR